MIRSQKKLIFTEVTLSVGGNFLAEGKLMSLYKTL